MPKLKLYGAAIDVGDLEPRQVRALPTTKAATAPIQFGKFCLNGYAASAQFQNMLHEATNAGILFRTKELWRAGGILGTGAGANQSSVSTTRVRWRGAFTTGPYHHAAICRIVMHPQSNGFEQPSGALVEVFDDADEASLVSSVTMYYGVSPTGSASLSGWNYIRWADHYLTGLQPETDYTIRVSDVNYGIATTISVGELASMTEHAGGYLSQSIGCDTEIVSTYRSKVADIQKKLIQKSAGTLLHWSSDNNQGFPHTFTSSTATNIIDQSSTTYTAAAPGYLLDMRGRARLSQTSGVPVKMRVAMKCTSTANGSVQLRDSSGTALITINNTGFANQRSWYSGTGFLPDTLATYYLTASTGIGTLTVDGISLWQHE